MPIVNNGGSLTGSANAVNLASTNKFNKYFMLQNRSGSEDILYGFEEANTIAGKAFRLDPGAVAVLNMDDQGAWSLWAKAGAAVDAAYTVATNGTIN